MSQRPTVVRVQGIEASSFEEAKFIVEGTMDNISELHKHESWAATGPKDTFKVTIVPSCQNRYFNALLDFKVLPKALNCLKENPKQSKTVGDLIFDVNFYGFTQLYPTTSTPVADVVFITGIGGHAYGSWSAKVEPWPMWPRHYLSREFPDYRVMTYGYDMDLKNLGFGETLDYARKLRDHLNIVRHEDPSRPLIFFAHSFGGNIVKACLVEDRDRNNPLHNCTIGTFFFAVPHKGMDLSDMLAIVVNGLTHASDSKPQVLNEINDWRRQLDSFRNVVSTNIRVVSFYETITTKRLVINSNGILSRSGEEHVQLEPESATLGLQDVFEAKHPVKRDHSAIVKFNSSEDQEFVQICHHLNAMNRTALSLPGQLPRLHASSGGPQLNRTFDKKKPASVAFKGPPLPPRFTSEAGTAYYGPSKSPGLQQRSTSSLSSFSQSNIQARPPTSCHQTDDLYFLAAEERWEELQRILRGTRTDDPREHPPTFALARASVNTVFLWASFAGRKDLVKSLLQWGANVDHTDDESLTAIHLAAWHGHHELVDILIDHGASLEARQKDGQTPLCLAAASGCFESTKILIQAGAQIDAQDHSQATPLFHAVACGDPNAVRLLLQMGADKNRHADKGLTPTHIAAGAGHLHILGILIEWGANVRALADGDATVLHGATTARNAEMVDRLLRAGCNPNSKTTSGIFPLLIAAAAGDERILQCLLGAGAQVNAKSTVGETALIVAASHGFQSIVEILLRAGANKHIRNIDGLTAHDIAGRNGHFDIIFVLARAP